MELNRDNLLNAYEQGFLDKDTHKIGHHPPRMIINSKEENVLSSMLDEMESCLSFSISVAFITEGGLATLKTALYELAKQNRGGRIITSTYLNFNKPKVFKALLNIPNLEVRAADKEGFHAKGYVFRNPHYSSMFIGSSNLTDAALKKNYEYNLKLTSLENGAVIQHFNSQFEKLWEESTAVDDEWIRRYEQAYVEQPEQRKVLEVIEDRSRYHHQTMTGQVIQPNIMQKEALMELSGLRKAGKDKGLVVSATGTGKTYLAAFDVQQYRPGRMLFLAHREQILEKSMNDFSKLLGESLSNFGLYSGRSKKSEAKYLFATVQTLSKEANLGQFNPDEFDYIIVDEAHRSSAATYTKILNHFSPGFLLGMTATPERADDMEIFSLFDYNIAYEIRLQQALEEEILSPFHYFGVTDYEKDGMSVDDTTALGQLTSNERIAHLIAKIEYYGHSGETLRGLMFVSNRAEAAELSRSLNHHGYRTRALTGDDSQQMRLQTVRELEGGMLDYIITVDIFNEGVDIPSINQVVMLRQTQSSIIFIQQLGRGLRKHDDKEYLTVIDFIGNYRNNYMIPIALTGDRSYNKDRLRKSLMDRNTLTGVSTINFESIAKEKIYKAINTTTLNTQSFLKEMHLYLKNKIGRPPALIDFHDDADVIDPLVILHKYSHYLEFLVKIKEKHLTISKNDHQVLSFLSKEITEGKRVHETLLLQQIIESPVNMRDFQLEMHRRGYHMTDDTMRSVLRNLTHAFHTQQDLKKYGGPLIEVADDLIRPAPAFSSALENPEIRAHITQVLELSLALSRSYDQSKPLTVNRKYSRKDVCRLLNWDKDESSTLYGYKYKHGTCPIFITYHKDEEIEDTIRYEDRFLDLNTLKWFTRSNRTLQSKEIKALLEGHREGDPIHIFVKKDDDEGSTFYYLGEGHIDHQTLEETRMNDGTGKPVVKMNMLMENPVDYDLYKYLESGTHE
ncbi:DUF3427 domain-containing protein [Salinicoccus roseus]|uniref:NgoFVII family restriction endonuclease n=1 Tax=Salinicoccus roseus TaxID=45670 RepID=A0A265E6I5_9STAP|nr:DEAD/DEAH box helicase [Salinicoccus roseus]OZT77204.1 NgoFVII family restriction endonuclease [Salinicoccus roseus]RPE55074.1 superfamily II DNA or RNA helicase [Salinicoccus roseus]GGA60280.1 helicase [Salinicoccus roseus]